MDLKPRNAIIILFSLFVIWCLFVVVITLKEYTVEVTTLENEISLLRDENIRIKIAFTDVKILASYLTQYLVPQQIDRKYNRLLWSGLSWETQAMLVNMTGLKSLPNLILPSPQLIDLLPHLSNQSESLIPKLVIASNPEKSDVSMVLGIPTVKRDNVSYLMTTLQGFLSCMTLEEERDTLIIIFIAETDFEYVNRSAHEIAATFPRQVSSGLIEIISPPAAFYPDWSTMKPTLGDTHDRFKWRSKATLDYIFLMMYARTRGKYFVQLEDDIITKPNFVTVMRETADNRTARNEPWLVIAFSDLGFIGKLFRNSDLALLIDFYAMFYKDQPVDWLILRIIESKLCNRDKSADDCHKLKHLLYIQYTPSLFQHIGKHSSLPGKIQNLQDRYFGTVAPFTPHNNPAAVISTSLQEYKDHTLERAYTGKDFFWSRHGTFGDHVTFVFQSPVNISRYLFRSGNREYPKDQFQNSSVEVISEKHGDNANYTVVGSFNMLGIAEGFVNSSLWPLRSLRLFVHANTSNWLLISEILLVDPSTQKDNNTLTTLNSSHLTTKKKIDNSTMSLVKTEQNATKTI